MRIHWKPFVFFCTLALGVGALSALLTAASMDLYSEIVSPPLAPPAVLFPIVWTILYLLMGIGAALVWRARTCAPQGSARALRLFALQLCFNFFWSLFFFRLRAFGFSFFWLLCLLLLILFMTVAFWRIRRLSAYLQIPYIVWVSFAGYLNLAIWLLNR